MEETHEVTHSLSPLGAAPSFHPEPFWTGWAPIPRMVGVFYTPALSVCVGAWNNSDLAPVKLLSSWDLVP